MTKKFERDDEEVENVELFVKDIKLIIEALEYHDNDEAGRIIDVLKDYLKG